jgi:hypothetical protein
VIAGCASVPDVDLRHDLQFAAREIELAAQKVLLGQRIRHVLQSVRSEAELDQLIDALAAMRDAWSPLVAEFEARWLHQARRSQIGLTLERFERTRQRFDAALEWMRDQRARLTRDEPVDAQLTTYDSGDGLILWEEGRAEHARLQELIG